MKRFLLIGLIICALIFNSFLLSAKEYKVAVKDLATKQIFIDLINAIGEATGNIFNIEVVPASRADYLIENKQVDIQYPIIILPDAKKQKELKYDYAGGVIFKVAFVLYTNKDKPIDIQSLRKGNSKNYKIEVSASRMSDFEYTVIPSNNAEASLTKVSNGTTDGLIFAQPDGDALLKKLGLKNIKRQLWLEYENTFSIQKGGKGGEIDKMLKDGINKLKKSGQFEKIMGNYSKTAKYDNWQP